MLMRMTLLAVLMLTAFAALADEPVYRERNKYPVLDEIKEARKAARSERDSVRQAVEAEWEARDKAREDALVKTDNKTKENDRTREGIWL